MGSICHSCIHDQNDWFWHRGKVQTGQCSVVCLVVGLAFCVCFVQVVLDIAIAAAAEARPTSLAVVYDELLRKEVENKADQLGQSWDFTEWFTHVDDNTLRQARRQAVCLCLRDCSFPSLSLQESAAGGSGR